MSAIAITKTLIFGIPSVYLVTVAAVWLYRKSRDRRRDREWARGIAQRVHDRRYLEWLEEQFDAEGSER